jgi:hypothetical protein
MKSSPLAALLGCFLLFGCASEPPKPRPFLGILSAQKASGDESEFAKYNIAVHYEDVVPGKYELKVGFGYVPTDEKMKAMISPTSGLYAIAYTTILDDANGDLRITVEPAAVRNLGGKLDGKIHAILSEYPHPEEWPVTAHDVFVLNSK